MNTQDEALSVTQADEIAISNCHNNHDLAVYWRQEAMKARHRLSHSTPGDAEVRGGTRSAEEEFVTQALWKVVAYDQLLRCIGEMGPDTIFMGEMPNVDAAYDDMVAHVKAALPKIAALATPSGRAQGEVE